MNNNKEEIVQKSKEIFGDNYQVPEFLAYTKNIINGMPDVCEFNTHKEWIIARQKWLKKKFNLEK